MDKYGTASRLNKPRLSSFNTFYSQTAKSLPPRCKSLESSGSFIDEELIDTIERITPNRIHRHLDKRMMKSHRIKTEQANFPPRASTRRVDAAFDRIREESLRRHEGSIMTEARVRKKYRKKQPKEGNFFKYSGLKWMERKYNTGGVKGVYSEKLHPYCLIYEKQCLQVSGKALNYDPFDSYVHIEFT